MREGSAISEPSDRFLFWCAIRMWSDKNERWPIYARYSPKFPFRGEPPPGVWSPLPPVEERRRELLLRGNQSNRRRGRSSQRGPLMRDRGGQAQRRGADISATSVTRAVRAGSPVGPQLDRLAAVEQDVALELGEGPVTGGNGEFVEGLEGHGATGSGSTFIAEKSARCFPRASPARRRSARSSVSL